MSLRRKKRTRKDAMPDFGKIGDILEVILLFGDEVLSKIKELL